jgi:hypothetical protein
MAEVSKKRGRKPKGCKIITSDETQQEKIKPAENVILHIKCSSHEALEWIRNGHMNTLILNNMGNQRYIIENGDVKQDENQIVDHESDVNLTYPSLIYDPNIQNIVKSIEPFDNTHLSYTSLLDTNDKQPDIPKEEPKKQDEGDEWLTQKYQELKTHILQNVYIKVRQIQQQLHTNELTNTKCNCFWDGHPFSNSPVFIPISETEGMGCFCCPECACGYLMNDCSIDDTTRWERYYLLNNKYGKVYGRTDNIKPAPKSQYFLKCYLGNMTIEEYREMIGANKLWLILDKPLSRVLPELHEEKQEIPIYSMNLLSKVNMTNSTKDEKSKYRLARNKPLPNKTGSSHLWGNALESGSAH